MDAAILILVGSASIAALGGLTRLAFVEPPLYAVFFPFLLGADFIIYVALGVWSSGAQHASLAAFLAVVHAAPGDMAALSTADIAEKAGEEVAVSFGWTTLTTIPLAAYLSILRIIPDIRDALAKKPPSKSH